MSDTTYTQQYSYHHGYYDHAEREFRGFGRVDSIDTDTANAFENDGITVRDLDQHPVLTKTWNHTGAWMRERTLLEAFADEYYPITGGDLPTAPDLPGRPHRAGTARGLPGAEGAAPAPGGICAGWQHTGRCALHRCHACVLCGAGAAAVAAQVRVIPQLPAAEPLLEL